jgi:hypothetical protein
MRIDRGPVPTVGCDRGGRSAEVVSVGYRQQMADTTYSIITLRTIN